jgi:hypothetical protein
MAKSLSAAKAKKILEDGNVRGKALTEKQKKFFGAVAGGATPLKKLNGGWLDKFDNGGVQPNYNDSNVSLPPGFEGYGYDKGGRAYNGAWDGPVTRMGGTIPGATGMMYSRTSGLEPLEPKKAQDGTVMYGTPEYEAAYREGRFADVPNVLPEVVIDSGVDYNQYPLYDKLSAQQKEYFNDPGPIGRGVRRAAQTDKGLAEDTRDMVTGMLVQQPLAALQAPQSLMVEGIEALRGKDANFLNTLTFDTQRTPSQAFNVENPYGAFALDAITDPMNLVGAGITDDVLKLGLKQGLKNTAVRNVDKITRVGKAKNFKEVLGAVGGIPPERSLARLSPEELKVFRKVQEIGRMRATNKPISEQYRYALDQGIPDDHFFRVFNKTKEEVKNILPDLPEQEIADAMRASSINLQRPPRRRPPTPDLTLNVENASPEEMQRFAENMGMTSEELFNRSQSRDSFIRHNLEDYADDINSSITDEELVPINSSIVDAILNNTRRAGSNVLQSKNSIDKIITNKFENIISEYPVHRGPVLQNVPSLHLSGSGSLKNVSKKVGDQSASGISSGDVFTGSLNTSHSSYLPQLKQVFKYKEGSPQFLGYNPMNELGFLSDYNYSAGDIAKYLNTEIDTQIKRGIIPNNIQRPFVEKNSVMLPHYGIKQFQEGGIIEDDRGQWAYPGEITKINSNNITMKGVDYPVLGISDTGDTKMMMPNQDYKFQGNSVTEYPMAQTGKVISKMGWLSKYQNGGSITDDEYTSEIRGDSEFVTPESIEVSKNRIKEYLNSEGFKRIGSKHYDNIEKEKNNRLTKLKNTPVHLVDAIHKKGRGWYSGMSVNNDIEDKRIEYPPQEPDEFWDSKEKGVHLEKYGFKGVPEHEFNHFITDNGKSLPDEYLKQISNRVTDPNDYHLGVNKITNKPFTYLDNPTEAHARIVNSRLLLQHSGIWDYNKEDFTEKHLENLKTDILENPKKYKVQDFQDLLKSVNSEEDLIWLMNNIASNDKLLLDKKNRLAKYGNSVTEYPMAQKGKTITVNSKDDPRYKAYQDSLNLYNDNYDKLENTHKDNINYDLGNLGIFYKNDKIKPIALTSSDGSPIYKKPEQKVIVKKSRPKQQSVTTLKSKDIVQPEISIYSDADIIIPKSIPTIPYNLSVDRAIHTDTGNYGFRNGELVKIQSRKEYRDTHLRPNGKEFKDGGSLVELNQLTNFTNYNTPQPGGWLDKYN